MRSLYFLEVSLPAKNFKSKLGGARLRPRAFGENGYKRTIGRLALGGDLKRRKFQGLSHKNRDLLDWC
jgi:hypothetical protein